MPPALRTVLIVLGLAAAAGGLHWLDLWQRLSVESMRALVEAWEPLGPLVFMAVFVAGFFIPGPEILLVAVGGVLFGPSRGFAYAWVASVAGTAATFLLVRYIAQAWAQRALRERFPRLRALDDRLERHGVATVVLLRLVLFLAPPLNWALGASRVRVRDYVVGTAIGVLPGIGLTVFLADRITAAGSTSELLDWDILGPAVILALLIAIGVRVGRRLLGGSRPGADTAARQADRRATG
jgi:phospholipase D1/2